MPRRADLAANDADPFVISNSPGLTIRPYRAGDRAAVLRIAADTAAFGAPVETFLDDRRLFCDAVYRYYVDFEPQHAWVAAGESGVAGFLVGCVDLRARERIYAQRIVPGIARNLLTGRYHVGARTLRYAAAQLAAALRREFPAVDLAAYPSHLHINLDAASRGQGAGRGLMEACLGQLSGLGTPGVHLRTTSLNTAAVALYKRLGFELLDERVTHVWAQVVAGPVENRAYGLRLD